jgi:hypothetical protein
MSIYRQSLYFHKNPAIAGLRVKIIQNKNFILNFSQIDKNEKC